MTNSNNIDENNITDSDGLVPAQISKNSHVVQMPVGDLMRKNYLNYAVSVIMDRALPDVRDGLKPVHRRILYAMYELKMFPTSGYLKCARMVGETMGRFHPHGDTSIYDAAVHMAQHWSKMVPLIDGQGNFGSMDGDSAAAMRYCFAAGTRVATEKGLIKIEDLVAKEDLEKALDHSNMHSYVPLDIKVGSLKEPMLASKWIFSGIQETVKLTTHNGFETICTPNEPLLILGSNLEYKWIDVKDLKIGDQVCMTGTSLLLKNTTTTDLKKYLKNTYITNINMVSYLIGNILSVINYDNDEILLSFKSKEEIDTFKDVVNKTFGSYKVFQDENLTISSKITYQNEIYQINIGKNSELYQFLTEIKLIEDNEVKVPEFLFSVSNMHVLTALNAFLSLDKNAKNEFKCASINVAHDLQSLFMNVLGFRMRREENILKLMNDWNVIEGNFARKSQTVEHLEETLGFKFDINIDNYEFKLKEIQERKYYYETVLSIEKDKLQPVFDLTIPETHAFIANGFIAHNTEARLTRAGATFFEDIDKDTVKFRDNYDGKEKEPEVLPVSYPNIWVNGAEGIAVGMATYLPPHNLNETINVTLALQKNPELTIEEILQIMPAPDFPTGGIVHDLDGFRNAILTGKGLVRVRAKWHTEKSKSGHELLILDELPYQVNKKELVENISERVAGKDKDADLSDVVDIHDESNKEGVRVVITLKKGTIPAVIFNHLVKKTKIEESYNYNVMLLEGQNPKQMGLKEILSKFLEFRKEVITRKINFELRKAKDKLHLLNGMVIVLASLQEAIELITENKDGKSANEALRNRFNIDETQAQSILDMRLQRLTGMEINNIKLEYEEVTCRVEDMLDALEKPIRIQEMISRDLLIAKEKFGEDRKTEVSYENNQINMADLIKKEPCLIHVTKNGYLKRMPLANLETQKRNGKGRMGIQTSDDDYVEAIYSGSTHDLFMVFTQSGKALTSSVWNLPDGTTAQKGRHLRNIFNTLNEPITNILLVPEIQTNLSVITVTSNGKVKRTDLANYTGTLRRKGVQGVSIEEDDTLVSVMLAKKHDHLLLVTSTGRATRFEIDDDALQNRGRKSSGVKGITMPKGVKVIGAMVIENNNNTIIDAEHTDTTDMDRGKYLLCVGQKGVGKRTSVSEFTPHSRGSKGVNCFNINDKTGDIVRVALVTEDQDLMMTTESKTIRIHVKDVRQSGRNTAGTMLMNVGNEKIIDVINVPQEEKIEEDEILDSLEMLTEKLHDDEIDNSENDINE